MIAINLIPTKERREIAGLSDIRLDVYVLVALCILILALYALAITETKVIQIEITSLKARMEALEDTKKKAEKIKSRKKELDEKIKAINMIEESRSRPLFIMEALAEAIPDRAWIDKFSENNSSAVIEGIAWDELTVSDFIKRLESFPYFQDVGLRAINTTREIKKLPLKAFLIESKLDNSINVKTEDKPKEKNGR